MRSVKGPVQALKALVSPHMKSLRMSASSSRRRLMTAGCMPTGWDFVEELRSGDLDPYLWMMRVATALGSSDAETEMGLK